MATSSITANFEITDPKAYLPSEASFASIRRGEAELPKAVASAVQSGYSSARAFVDGLWKAYRMKPPRRPKNVQFVSVTDPDEIRALMSKWKHAKERKVA